MSFNNDYDQDYEYDPDYRWEDYEDILGYLIDEYLDNLNVNRKDAKKWRIRFKKNRRKNE